MVRIAVMDNESAELKEFADCLQFTALELQQEYQIDFYLCGKDLLAADYSRYDLICLDIDMPEPDGMMVAAEIRRHDDKVLIMFVTHMAQMAIQGYDVQAIDFVLKPVNRYALLLKMQRILKTLQQQMDAYIRIPDENGFRKISSNDLFYVEVSGHYLFYHTKYGVFRQKESLKQMEESLKALYFRKCNQCYLVNLKHVNAVHRDDVQIGTEWLKISRSRKKEFLNDLTIYMEGGCGK